ncbi:hypothetical protein LVD15_07760 [Fulvivirga maritima]|uniref:type VI secretion system tube protein TssD n=1 Tax=Fulvivirga maritima TaxID=2904247 RepID=UPI001F3CA58F|nr:type VI secretion system tube protein TssD [Fulvivirga maritima]UII28313.1 hypothetical protein LVD15_07760 [Fulvivirga maritima]
MIAKRLILLGVALIMGLSLSYAQENGPIPDIKIRMKTPEEKEYHEYHLQAVDYYYVREAYDSNDSIPKPEVSITIAFPTIADEYLLRWISQSITDMEGEILINNKNTGELLRKLSFGGGRVYSYNESFSDGYSFSTSPQMSISVKEIRFNDISMY